MKIRIINPNTTVTMTTKIGACARAIAGPGVRIDAVNPSTGPESIESSFDEALCTPGVLGEVLKGEQEQVDAYVIACFGDPGLNAARELAQGPVVGIAEAAMRTASYLGRTFSIVTTLERTTGHILELTHTYGVEQHCAGVHASGVAVTELETDDDAYSRVLSACWQALAIDRSEVLVLGCAGMADLTDKLSDELGVPVVEGVTAAVTAARSLVEMGLRTSKKGEFAPPPKKHYAGLSLPGGIDLGKVLLR